MNRNKKHFLLFDTYIKSLLFLLTPNININKILKCEKNSIFLEHLEVLNSFFFFNRRESQLLNRIIIPNLKSTQKINTLILTFEPSTFKLTS